MIFDLRGLQRGFLVGVVVSVLTACGGGGDGIAFVAEARPEPEPLADPQLSVPFDTPEFRENYGLNMIGAQFAYELGAYGDGVIVAVIDSGIDEFHPDLINNISSASIDIVEPGSSLIDDGGHGTLVAGVIAAERNGIGMHGVAFDATILAIRADNHDPVTDGEFFDSDLAVAIEYAIANLAHIINMSLGGPVPDSAASRQWQINAIQAGVILVSATGNDRDMAGEGEEPNFPAANAGDPAFNGLALAVGAVDADRNLASFSNFCGASQDFCLVAPGVAIVTTAPSDGVNNRIATVSGTSFAVPHVSGAAALLIQLFPNLSPQEVVRILLISATDIGAAGVDPEFGHGLLNVSAAMAPLGTLAVPLEDLAAGQSAVLGDTRLSLGSAFGDALSGIGLLGDVVALDDFDRPYPVDLLAAVTSPERGFQLESRLAASDTQIISMPAPGLMLRMAIADDQDSAAWSRQVGPQSAGEVDAVSLTGVLATDTGWHLGLGLSAEGQLDRGPVASSSDALFLAADEISNPHYALLGSGGGVRLDQSLSEATTLSLGWFASDPVESGGDDLDWGGGNIFQATLDHAFAEGGRLRLDVARLEESDTFLGSQSGGAFGAGVGATSNFATMSGGIPIAAAVDLIGSVTTATTEVAGSGLLGDWGTVRSTAFGAGVVARDVFDPGDRVGLLAGQPLRVHQADATLTVPVGMTADEVVISESQRVDLSPSGREMNVQLAYDRGLWQGARLSSWLMMRTEPGHDAGAPNDYGIGLVFRMAY